VVYFHLEQKELAALSRLFVSHVWEIGIFLCYVSVAILILVSQAFPQPVISNVQGSFEHGQTVTISGQGFGAKAQASPHRVSYHSDDPAEGFQQSGRFNDAYWTLTGDIMVSLQDEHTRLNEASSHRYYGRLEYSARGSWGSSGYSAGINTTLPETDALYISWWEYFDPDIDFSQMFTGNANIKWIYFSPGHNPAHAITINNDGARMQSGAASGVAGTTREEQDANLDSDFTIGFYGRPNSWSIHYPANRGAWYFVEIIEKINSAPGTHDGWMELRLNNKKVYRATQTDIFSDSNPVDASSYPNIRFGGNYGFNGNGVYYRYYGDFYIDSTFSRVMLGDAPSLAGCTKFELQVPSSWSNSAIAFTVNQGALTGGQTAYLYVVDSSNVSGASYPVTIVGDIQKRPEAPSDLQVIND
jgi:hypothetical protein